MEWSGATKECSDVGAGGGGWRLKREAEEGVKVGGANGYDVEGLEGEGSEEGNERIRVYMKEERKVINKGKNKI